MVRRPDPRAARRVAATRDASATGRGVRDFSGGSAYAIEWDVRPVYDFLFSLSDDAGSTDDLPAPDRQWLLAARASLPADARAAVARLFGGEVAIPIAAIAVERPEIRTPGAFVKVVAGAAPATVLGAIFSEVAREPGLREVLEAALGGDRAALRDVEARLPDWNRAERMAMLADPAATHAEIVALLSAWLASFEPIADRVAAILERDYAGRAADRGSHSPPSLIERTTNGLRWLGEPGVRRVILAPSYFARPYNFLLAGADWRFFGYPVADDALGPTDPLAPPAALLRLHRALGDETRLRILKLLSGRDLYLTEIAQHLDLSKPTIKHHLSLLRAAGLVTITEAGAVTYYSLRYEPLDAASVELRRFVTTEADE